MKNEDISLELLEIKMAIHAVAEKQNEDSKRTDEVYDRVFKNGLLSDIVKTSVQLENILSWKKNINKIAVIVCAGLIMSALSILLFTDIIPK